MGLRFKVALGLDNLPIAFPTVEVRLGSPTTGTATGSRVNRGTLGARARI